jgi:hypothetical protein
MWYNRGMTTVNLIRKLWKEKVSVPVLQKQVDKTLYKIDVKLKQRSKNERHD